MVHLCQNDECPPKRKLSMFVYNLDEMSAAAAMHTNISAATPYNCYITCCLQFQLTNLRRWILGPQLFPRIQHHTNRASFTILPQQRSFVHQAAGLHQSRRCRIVPADQQCARTVPSYHRYPLATTRISAAINSNRCYLCVHHATSGDDCESGNSRSCRLLLSGSNS